MASGIVILASEPVVRRPRSVGLVGAIMASLVVHSAVAAVYMLSRPASLETPPAILVELVQEPLAGPPLASSTQQAQQEIRQEMGREIAQEMGQEAAPSAPLPDFVPPSATPPAFLAQRLRPTEPSPASATPSQPTSLALHVAVPPRAKPQRPLPQTAPVTTTTTTTLQAAIEHVAASHSPTPPRYYLGSGDNPLPPYPYAARRRGVEGRVVLWVAVGSAGAVQDLRVSESSGSSLLDQAALTTVRHWRFTPAHNGRHPQAGKVLVPIAFRLAE